MAPEAIGESCAHLNKECEASWMQSVMWTLPAPLFYCVVQQQPLRHQSNTTWHFVCRAARCTSQRAGLGIADQTALHPAIANQIAQGPLICHLCKHPCKTPQSPLPHWVSPSHMACLLPAPLAPGVLPEHGQCVWRLDGQ